MTRFPKAFLSATILSVGLIAAPAMAQTAKGQPSAPAQATQQSVQPTDAQLKKFVDATKKVAALADEYQPKVRTSSDDAAREQLMREADEKMVKAVQSDGLTVEEYNGIGAAVQQDPELRQRAIDMANRSGG